MIQHRTQESGPPGAVGAALLLAGVVFLLRPGDPSVFTIVAARMALVSLLASLVPSQGAMDVEPNVALRYDA